MHDQTPRGAITGLLSSRKALVSVIVAIGVLTLVAFGRIPWDDGTRQLLGILTIGWLGSQSLEDVGRHYVTGKLAQAMVTPAPPSTGGQQVVNVGMTTPPPSMSEPVTMSVPPNPPPIRGIGDPPV